jgi:hypothetical protein
LIFFAVLIFVHLARPTIKKMKKASEKAPQNRVFIQEVL